MTAHFATAVRSTTVKPALATRRFGLDILYVRPGEAIPTERTVKAVEVTPALAQDWLDRYADPLKRLIRNGRVAGYARDMKDGKWLDQSAHNLDFTENGTTALADGHHRLNAIVLSGVTVWLMVNFGSDPRSRQVEGNRITRTAADMLRMEGCPKHQSNIASALKIVLLHEQTVGTRRRWSLKAGIIPPDNESIVLTWMEDQALWDVIATPLTTLTRGFTHGYSPQAIMAAGLLMERKYPGEGIRFIDDVRLGGGPRDGYGFTVKACLESIRQSGVIKTSGGGTREEWARAVMAVMIRAFNGRKAGKFQRPEIGALTKPFLIEGIV